MNILLVLLLLLGYATTSGAQIYYSSLDEIRREANKGNAQGLYDLGCCYYNGSFGIEQDFKSAVEWFRKAADKGNSNAMYMLGCCYIDEEGVELDYIEGLKYLRLADQKGDKHARTVIEDIKGNGHHDWGEIGFSGYYDQGVLDEKKIEDLKHKAVQGNVYACLVLGHSYKNKKDYINAFQYYQAAANTLTRESINQLNKEDAKSKGEEYSWDLEGLPMEICDQLGWCYEHGYGTKRDYKKAIEFYHKSDFFGFGENEDVRSELDSLCLGMREGCAPSPTCMIPEIREGLCYLKLKDYKTASSYFCYKITEVLKNRKENWHMRPAHPAEPLWAAEIYYRGWGVDKNYKLAREILEFVCDDETEFGLALKAYQIAPQIYADACYRLYEFYKNGIGCEKDLAKANAYFKMALKFGSTSAIYDDQVKYETTKVKNQ